jgi:glycosyltransferase involved in cell wall biosynthesis
MHRLTSDDFPRPPAEKQGWPWHVVRQERDDCVNDGGLPKVTVVTPSYNQAQFLEETIRSVLLQDYPNLEYLVIDGGSTDGSLEIIQRYAPWLTHWVSEPDQGQSDAINKGWTRARGMIVAYLNSDDVYTSPGAISEAIAVFARCPEAGLVYGDCFVIDEFSEVRDRILGVPADLPMMLYRNRVPQPAAFVARRVLDELGLLDPGLHFLMDYDLFTRIAARFPLVHTTKYLAGFRVHSTSKTTSRLREFLQEQLVVISRRLVSSPSLTRHQRKYFAGAYLFTGLGAVRQGDPAFGLTAIVRAVLLWPGVLREIEMWKALMKIAAGKSVTVRIQQRRASRRVAAIAAQNWKWARSA